MTLLVVGAGLAAATLITTLREAGDDRPIVLVGEEDQLPYERPGLSKGVLLGNDEVDSLFVHDQAWYDDHGVETVLGDTVTGLQVKGRTATLSSGRSIDFDDVVLATGASPRLLPLPGVELGGIHTLRRIPDSLELKELFRPGVQVVIVGAGWIGLEVAAAARQAGSEVTVLEYADVPLRAAMGDQLGGYFAELHRRHGVDLRTGVAVEGFEGAGRVSGVRVGGDVVPADLVVVGVGAAPNTALAEQAGLEVDNGVLVDDQLRAAEHVYAIGDVANAEHTSLGRLRVEHWDNAIRQGRLLASVLGGSDDRYDWQPYFYTDQFDLGMEYVGRGSADDDVVIRTDTSSGEFIAFWQRDGVVTAAMNVNVWDVNDQLRALVGRAIAADRLADQTVPLDEL